MVTWNAAALFCSRFAEPKLAMAKMARYQQLLRGADIVFIQEAHGQPGDAVTLAREAASHMHYASFAPSPAAGGVIISISNAFAAAFTSFEEDVLAPGWCFALRCRGPGVATQFINIHVEPALNFSDKVRLLELIAVTASSFDGVTFMAGDFNFVHSDEARFQLEDCRDTIGDSRLALRFEVLFTDFTELHQAAYTRRQVTAGITTTLSRLDRIYTNMQPCLLHDYVVHTHAVGYITNPNNISDHIPVSACLQPPTSRTSSCPRLSSWTLKHPEFMVTSRDLLDTCPLPSSGIAGISVLREVLHATAKVVLDIGGAEGASTTPQMLYWSLMAMRGARDGRPGLISRAFGAYPKLLEWCRTLPPTVALYAELHNHITELSRTNIDDMRAELESDPSIAEWKKIGKRESLRRRATAWATSRRRTSTFTILDSRGAPATSTEHSTQLLAEHWGAVFDATPCSRVAQQHILQHVVPAPDDINWRLSREQFIEIAERCSDSAPGPDGIPYSAWVRADPRFIDCVHRAYDELLDGARLPDDFNDAHMVFLPKGEQDGDEHGIARLPESTRPLSLSNAVAKVVASAMNASLSQMAARTVSSRQRGFVRGRHLLDNVLETEASAVHFARFFGDSSGIVLLDLAAAFPSLAHSWIFSVLKKMGVPRFFRRALAKLYRKVNITILFGGSATAGFAAKSGIKQGCPASGSLFAIALDPFLRMLCLRLPAPLYTVSAFADDMAIVTRKLFHTLAIIADLFALLGSATAMKLNPKKSIIIPLGRQTAFAITRHIVESIPSLGGVLVRSHGRYLGFMIGPTAEDARWDSAAAKFWQRGMAARDAGGGFFHNILHYSIYATSVLGYLMQYAKLPKVILRMEARLLQYFTHGPWHAIPSRCLLALCDVGFPKEPVSLSEANCAAMLRAACASPVFAASAALIESQSTDPEALIFPRHISWMASTAIVQLCANHKALLRRFPTLLIHPCSTLQARARIALRASRSSPWGVLLGARTARWFGTSAPRAEELIQRNLTVACTILPPRVVFSTLRLINNGLATARRFQETPRNCHLCGWVEGDCLEHYIHCEVMLNFAISFLPNIGVKFGPVFGNLRCMLSTDLSRNELIATVVANDLLVTTLAAITLGSVVATPVQHMAARLRALSRTSATIRHFLTNGAPVIHPNSAT
jgi:endonuclease/exonuclease/phosphatase family metal-dependent hydrolase